MILTYVLAATILCLAYAAAWLLILLSGPVPAAAEAPPAPDPYQAQVEEFRAALGDWDRRGRP